MELNLALTDKEDAQWTHVRLSFVRGADQETKAQAGKHDWAVFLCTDAALTATEILELYAMRGRLKSILKKLSNTLAY